jgi:hypothetical protein
MGFSPVAVVQQVHNRQVTHITQSNNTFNQNTKHNNKGHPTTMNTKQIRLTTTVNTETIQQLQQIQQKN